MTDTMTKGLQASETGGTCVRRETSTADDPLANYKFVGCLLRSLVARRLVTSRLTESRVRRLSNVLGIAATKVLREPVR